MLYEESACWEEGFLILGVVLLIFGLIAQSLGLIVLGILFAGVGGIALLISPQKRSEPRIEKSRKLSLKLSHQPTQNEPIWESQETDTCGWCGALTIPPYVCDDCHQTFCWKHESPKSHHCKTKRRPKKVPKKPTQPIAGICTACQISVPWPFICKRCGKSFCAKHHLPESHHCEKLHTIRKTPLTKPKTEECTVCGKRTIYAFRCEYCGHPFCADHRLPEKHDCEKLAIIRRTQIKDTQLKDCEICGKKVSSLFYCKFCKNGYCFDHWNPDKHDCKIKPPSPLPKKIIIPPHVAERTEFDRFCFHCGLLVRAGTQCEACIASGVEVPEMSDIEKRAREGLDKWLMYS